MFQKPGIFPNLDEITEILPIIAKDILSKRTISEILWEKQIKADGNTPPMEKYMKEYYAKKIQQKYERSKSLNKNGDKGCGEEIPPEAISLLLYGPKIYFDTFVNIRRKLKLEKNHNHKYTFSNIL
jgi:hypothetical protein